MLSRKSVLTVPIFYLAKKKSGTINPSPTLVVESTGKSMVSLGPSKGSSGCNGKERGVPREGEVHGLVGNVKTAFNHHNMGLDFTHRLHNVINQDFMPKTVIEEQVKDFDTQLKEIDAKLAKSDHQDFNSINHVEFDSRAPKCPSAQSQNNEARDPHDSARAPMPFVQLHVLPKWSRKVRKANPTARLATESLSGKKWAVSNIVIFYDLPSKRQQFNQSDVEGFFKVVEADHQPHQEQ